LCRLRVEKSIAIAGLRRRILHGRCVNGGVQIVIFSL
jgi:hypothetical protein